ncbi:tyrosine-type recombinase/integrase [Clostridium cochlearium]|uniref:Tyrosine-type recombinase/integrase n=1 Tax=Clostridium cochlearium TaxID=1494 RepID=A0A7Y3Y0L8_CLOCO|nr:tyrosine-type recombinase/integrase [Clostridium cochlearium]NOH17269.1 tyrosine-type recombinase/integrase [Clostridium cochlearium]
MNGEQGYNIRVKVKELKIFNKPYSEDILSNGEVERILKYAKIADDKRAVAIVTILYLTGMRVSELLSLKLYDIADTVMVCGKGDKYREIFISPKAIKAINDYIENERLDNSEYLFTGLQGAICSRTVDHEIKKYAGKARIKLAKAHAHNFRHSFCTNLVKMGVSLDIVAELAGHSSIDTTRIYTKRSKKELYDVISKL